MSAGARRTRWVTMLLLALVNRPRFAHARPAESPALFAQAASADPDARAGAVWQLAAADTPNTHVLLLHMLRADVDARVRLAAANALATTHNPDLAPTVKLASEGDPDPAVRAAAARAYEQLWPFDKSPGTALGWALVAPGAGHFYLRQPVKGAAFTVSAVGLLAAGLVLQRSPDATIGDPDDPNLRPRHPLGFLASMGAQNVWFYNMFSAYRDARLLRGDIGYRYPISRETLDDLAAAPFSPSVLKSPWVWGGLPAMLGLAVAFSAIVSPSDFRSPRHAFDGQRINFLGHRYPTASGFALGEAYLGGLFLPVGVGEESLFRGVLQSSLSESLGPWGGWGVASAIFGGVHVFNFTDDRNAATALYAVPFISFVGSYFGLVYMKSGYQLSRGVALHFWYDFLLSTIGFIADPDHAPFIARYGTSF